MSAPDYKLVQEAAIRSGIADWRWLYLVIGAESGWRPTAANTQPGQTAKGLLQWVDTSARELGYRDSLDLITKHPTAESQLSGPVVAWFKKMGGPYNTEQKTYLTVFLPKYRSAALDTVIETKYQAVNPGIKTVGDYIDFVRTSSRKNGYPIESLPASSSAIVPEEEGITADIGLLFLGIAALYLFFRRK